MMMSMSDNTQDLIVYTKVRVAKLVMYTEIYPCNLCGEPFVGYSESGIF